MSVAHSRQKVHSNVQIIAFLESGGRSQSQHSQFGRSWSIGRDQPEGTIPSLDTRDGLVN